MKLDHDIQENISNLRTEFGDIVVQALKWLENRHPETKDAVRWLNATLHGLQSEPLPVPSSSVSDTVPLDDRLQKRWSFTNPAILEGLVEKTNERDLIEKMKKYNEHFKYVRRSIPISDEEIILEGFNPDKRCLILIFKNITYFDDIELFLREVFDIYRRYLRVHKIEPGCVKVTLQFDASMESDLQECIDKKRESVKHYATMCIKPNKNQTETQVDDTSKENLKSTGKCIEEETGQPRQPRSSSYGRRRSPVFILSEFRKRANTTDARLSVKMHIEIITEKPENLDAMSLHREDFELEDEAKPPESESESESIDMYLLMCEI